MNVSLPDVMKQYIESQVKTGKYSNTSDYVRDLIRRDQEYNAKVIALRNALEDGEASGVSDKNLEDIWQDV
jgi:antitoxin ParD1/3/4